MSNGGCEPPLLLMFKYDSTIVANHILLPLDQNNPDDDFHCSKDSVYNCCHTVKYSSLPAKTSVDYIAGEGRTYISITGPTSQCTHSFSEMWDSTSAPSSEDGMDPDSMTIFDEAYA